VNSDAQGTVPSPLLTPVVTTRPLGEHILVPMKLLGYVSGNIKPWRRYRISNPCQWRGRKAEANVYKRDIQRHERERKTLHYTRGTVVVW
jgi:hypothetical protein